MIEKLSKSFTAFAECIEMQTLDDKDVMLLQTFEDLMVDVNAGLTISCKSAKDRTSMAVTLFQARTLVKRHTEVIPQTHQGKSFTNLSSTDKQELAFANIMRQYGPRLQNAHKNISKEKFAFNAFQRKMLPKMYRPPQSTIGAEVS